MVIVRVQVQGPGLGLGIGVWLGSMWRIGVWLELRSGSDVMMRARLCFNVQEKCG